MIRPVLALVLLVAPARLGLAQGPGEVELARLPYPVRVDGVVTDSAWDLVEPLPLTMHAPAFGGRPAERTEIRVAYDDEYLYASGRVYDSRPGEMRINSLYRDRWSGDDTFALFVDGFNDNETGLWFGTTPAGIRIEQTISDDARVYNDSWNAVWDVATTVTDEGWFAEVRIPFATWRHGGRFTSPVDDRLGLNLRIRYNFGEGSDLWLVYDEGFNTEREGFPGEPRLPLPDSRVLLVKLTRTFTP